MVEKGLGWLFMKLNKVLYGLKQAPRAWNKRIDGFFLKIGFEKCKVEYGVYVKEENGDVIILCLYVDDLLIIGGNEVVIQIVKK